MDLQLKHIAPYYPYDLRCEYLGLLSGSKKIGILKELSYNRVSFEHKMYWSFSAFKPIFKPLSKFGDSDDLRKVHEFVGFGKWCDAYDEYFKAWLSDAANIDKLVLQAPYEVFIYFLANHYDVFSLIPQGLAIAEVPFLMS